MDYQKPKIETLKAGDIIEMLGPVSCGSADPASAVGGGDATSALSSSGGGIRPVSR